MGLIDMILIGPYRVPGHAMFGFFLGTFCLVMWCVVLGELTLSLALRFNRAHLKELRREINEREALSLAAHATGDKAGFKALNKQANDAWGKHFFTMAAYSAGMLWPVPFALAWMDSRFHTVDFNLFWPLSLLIDQVRYPFIFIPMYVLGRYLFGCIRSRLPYFRGVQKMLDNADHPAA